MLSKSVIVNLNAKTTKRGSKGEKTGRVISQNTPQWVLDNSGFDGGGRKGFGAKSTQPPNHPSLHRSGRSFEKTIV